MRKLCLLLSLSLLSLAAAAEVYKYTDEKGVVHYTDQPPSKGARPASLPPLQTVPSDVIAGSRSEPDAPSRSRAAAAAEAYSLSIVSPTPEQTFREPGGNVEVSVSVQPELQSGYGLMFYVDGAPATPEPVAGTGVSLSGLERGAHAIAVALVDADGKEVTRSSVTVYMKPPTVKPRVVPRK
ncbi:MAG TPA: DUF4124 domain-containing protein [Solimonas sp.]|nr:DUF4124 domain-containing protein [Solimonas sp.]